MVAAAVVRSLWDAVQARDWIGARALLAADLVVEWPHTGELFGGADLFIDVQREYPGDWQVEVEEVLGVGDRVAAQVVIDAGAGGIYRCAGFYEVSGGRITDAVEYWVEEGAEAAPLWRTDLVARGPEAPSSN